MTVVFWTLFQAINMYDILYDHHRIVSRYWKFFLSITMLVLSEEVEWMI